MDRASILVMSSHDAKVLMQLCNRVAWIEKGRIRQLGGPAEVIAAYNASIVAPPATGA
jgi:ABC-type polysaccharide/polyol phosphate transport system ATPase subunit